jgi:uncharacterized protein YbaP (TraB family)
MIFPWLREKKLKMVWKTEKEERIAFLVGTAHFSPYRFRKSLTELIQSVEDVLFEGPLDPESMAKVTQHGRQTGETPSLYEALEPAVFKEINERLNVPSIPHRSAESYLQLFTSSSFDFLESHVRGVRPWMAFFTLWSAYLNWKYSIDMEAFRIAQKMGKKIHLLETTEEQLAALDGIPFERIVEYVNRFEHWKSYKEQLLNDFLEGNLEKLMSRTTKFPTRCESILGQRDVRFFERMNPLIGQGASIAFLGLSHIPAIKKMFLDEGYKITQIAS